MTGKSQKVFFRTVFKRLFDLFLVVVVTPIFLPIMIVVFCIISLQGGKPIFRHSRVGLNGKHISVFKFRTMVHNAESKLEETLSSNTSLRREWDATHKLENDPRVTKIGRLLRKSKLDELPQIFNVINGSLSFVGPRPLTIKEFDTRFTKSQAEIYLSVRPGITGHWQSQQSQKFTYADRIQMEIFYVENMSFALDIKILWLTLLIIIRSLK